LQQIGDGSAASIRQEWDLQSDVDIPGEPDRHGPLPLKRSDNDDDENDDVFFRFSVTPDCGTRSNIRRSL